MDCWYCGNKLIWKSDFNYDEVHFEGEGIVTYLNCSDKNCGAEVQYNLESKNSCHIDEQKCIIGGKR